MGDLSILVEVQAGALEHLIYALDEPRKKSRFLAHNTCTQLETSCSQLCRNLRLISWLHYLNLRISNLMHGRMPESSCNKCGLRFALVYHVSF